VVVGYYKQDGLTFRPDQRVIEVVKDIAEVIPLASGDKVTAAQFLTLFQFPPNTHYTEVARLSGGERRRLHLLTILMKNPNFLVLDEPTNDLDLPTLNVLEDFLTHYEGCLVMVSHDRYFMNRLVEHLFVFTGNGIVEDYNGTYTEWREEQREAEEKARLLAQAAQAAQPRPSTEVRNAGVKRKLTFNEQKEYGRLENEITGHEAERESLLQQLGTGTMSHDELLRLSNRIAELEQLIDSKTNRWVELSEWA
jgi:ATP-binding cassette subfamily F protein uup